MTQFRIAVKQHPEDPALRVRWGRLFLESEQLHPKLSVDCSKEAAAIKKDYAPGNGRHGIAAARNFDRKAADMAQRPR